MKLFSLSLIICLVISFSETRGNFVNDVRDKFGKSGKSYSIKMKSVTKDTKNSESDEKKLLSDREKATKKIEERLLTSYQKLRDNARNGLAVVPVSRGACGGCFNTVPPQR